ncbi:hypothetical protein R1sor_004687 [Riccia sorocarpa]|uniref:Uncharacterized protein n=1 Tax=Riccia sorocarpa TaxID=122646 RepID=A0ABD3HJD1_9MARC
MSRRNQIADSPSNRTRRAKWKVVEPSDSEGAHRRRKLQLKPDETEETTEDTKETSRETIGSDSELTASTNSGDEMGNLTPPYKQDDSTPGSEKGSRLGAPQLPPVANQGVDVRTSQETPVDGRVEVAARRIRFGEVFASFNEFELCLDCWCVVIMRASHKFKRNPDCRVRICRYGLPTRKKGVGKSCEWTPSEPSGSSQGLEPPHVFGVRSFNDFAARRNTPAFPTLRPDRPDLNLEEQVFSQCTQRQKKRVGVKGGCGEKDRYETAQMVRFTHSDSD